jgi:hypothetical protein
MRSSSIGLEIVAPAPSWRKELVTAARLLCQNVLGCHFGQAQQQRGIGDGYARPEFICRLAEKVQISSGETAIDLQGAFGRHAPNCHRR